MNIVSKYTENKTGAVADSPGFLKRIILQLFLFS